MNKFFRLMTTLVVALGVALLFAYLSFTGNADKSQMLTQPSYYIRQNYQYLLLAGAGSIVFSLISCFLSWNRKLDPKKEAALPNAVGADKDTLTGWLSGSSLDTKKDGRRRSAKPAAAEPATVMEDTVTQQHVQDFTEVLTRVGEDTEVADNTVTEIQEVPDLFDRVETLLDKDEDEVTVLEGGRR